MLTVIMFVSIYLLIGVIFALIVDFLISKTTPKYHNYLNLLCFLLICSVFWPLVIIGIMFDL